MADRTGVTYNSVLKLGRFTAEADYSATGTDTTNLAMEAGAADGQVVTAGAGAAVLGVRVNKPALGKPVELIVIGTAPLKLGGSVSFGDPIKSDASGQGVEADTDKDEYFSRALEDGVSGDEIEVLMEKGTISK